MKKALAHETHTDANVSAQMHIDPNDRPAVGQEAKFYFTFKDSSGQFQLQQCDCKITLLKDDVEIETQPVQISDSAFASLGSSPLYTKTFTEPGEYELELTGTPKNGAVFQPFELHYDVQTQPASSHHMGDKHIFASEHIGHILIFGGGLVAAIILLVRNYLQNRKQKTEENN